MSPIYRQFEQTLALHCAPSLAGIKPADLISWAPPEQGGGEVLDYYAKLLDRRGICLRALGPCRKRTLLLIFRPRQLNGWLEQPQVAAMLEQAGYPVSGGTEALLRHLGRRLEGGTFPHEIGLFLGYPPEDVAGFLRDGGRSCKLCGPWKVYGDVEAAERRFAAFQRCRASLSRRVAQGIPLAQVFPA